MYRLPRGAGCYEDLISRHFIMEEGSTAALDLLGAKYRTRQAHLPELAALHIFVVTLRCTNRCIYCQATRKDADSRGWDMEYEVADEAVDFMFQGPSQTLKVEFQGGEPLLNFSLVQHITEACEERAAAEGKRVEFVVCTNLSEFTPSIGAYCRSHNIAISTSLDGPPDLHNAHRCNSHALVVAKIDLAREWVGADRVSALMTPTSLSLGRVRDIIDEYVARGFSSIFLRPLNPYGYATLAQGLSMSVDEWLDCYREGLDYILWLNRRGIRFREEFAAILLRRILTNVPAGFVDLQSPSGAGTAVLVYFGDSVYLSDESRMLAAMGDDRFRLAVLGRETFAEAMRSPTFVELLLSTMTEGVPMCHECAFQPYCGADPVGHYREQKDVVGHKAFSEFCKRHMGVFVQLFELLETPASKILTGWI